MDEQKKLRSPILEIWRRLQGGKKEKGYLKSPGLLKESVRKDDQKK